MITDVEFERLLSTKPYHRLGDELPCIREMIFNYYVDLFEEDKANRLTKAYTDELFKIFVSREA